MKLQELSTLPMETVATTEWDKWEAQIEADARAGLLDGIIDQAVQDFNDGKTELL